MLMMGCSPSDPSSSPIPYNPAARTIPTSSSPVSPTRSNTHPSSLNMAIPYCAPPPQQHWTNNIPPPVPINGGYGQPQYQQQPQQKQDSGPGCCAGFVNHKILLCGKDMQRQFANEILVLVVSSQVWPAAAAWTVCSRGSADRVGSVESGNPGPLKYAIDDTYTVEATRLDETSILGLHYGLMTRCGHSILCSSLCRSVAISYIG